ncbi:hypothetical protein GH733_019248, partial [Mirounga leonina]
MCTTSSIILSSFIVAMNNCKCAVLKAALVIQNWYRSYCARWKARQRYALTIFQSIEYADEQGQLQILHAHYVLEVLFETKRVLKQMPNFTHNGLPSGSNSYIFNGDFVDRGKHSIEILMILFVSFLVYPNDLHLNRGNHEDFMMNLRYGFTKEILHKYKMHGKKILQILEDVYTWLPIGTIIDNEILVIHGGISESTDLNLLHRIERNKMKSVLMPPIPLVEDRDTDLKTNKVGATLISRELKTNGSLSEQLTKHEWEQVIDILWSDPRDKRGCYPNTSRGGGCYFGPDITSKVLNKYQLKMLIRSHECKPEGYEICHDGKVVTVFSASNYYEEGSNRGAYIKLCCDMTPRFFQYQVTRTTCSRPLYQRKTFYGPVGFFHGEHFGAELTMEITEFSSGLISMEEFRAMWKLFNSHYSIHIDDFQIDELAERMDLNKDGSIDFNEFLKAFYSAIVIFLLVLPFPEPERSMASTIFLPSLTLPKTKCLPSDHSGFGSGGEKLGTICVGASICPGQDARTHVLQEAILIKFLPIDGLGASAMMACDVTTLAQKLQHNPVKAGTFILSPQWSEHGSSLLSLNFANSSREPRAKGSWSAAIWKSGEALMMLGWCRRLQGGVCKARAEVLNVDLPS